MTKVRKPQMAAFEKRNPLKKEDVTCPICWSVLIEPVTLPCKHNLCLTCFQKHLNETSLACPCCRRRLSVWSRKACKENNLVNLVYWERIQREFPKLVYAKLNNQDSQDLEPDDSLSAEDNCDARGESRMELDSLMSTSPHPPPKRDGETAAQGEIRQEFEHMYKHHLEDLENQRKQEARASCEFIRKIQEEESKEEEEQRSKLEADLEYAKRLQMEEDARLKALALSKRSSVLEKDTMVKKPLCRNLLSEWGSATVPNPAVGVSPSTEMKFSSQLSNNSHTPQSSSLKRRSSASNNSNKSKNAKRTGKSSSQSSILNFFNNSQGQDRDNSVLCSSPQPSTSAAAMTAMNSNNLASSFVVVGNNFSGNVVSPYKSILSSPVSKLDMNNISPNTNQLVVTFADDTDVHSGRGTPDSIHVELNSHFRPIRSAPKTPPKRLADGTYLPEPKIVKTTPIRPSPKSATSVIAPAHNGSTENIVEDSELDLDSTSKDSGVMTVVPLSVATTPGSDCTYKGLKLKLNNADHIFDTSGGFGGSEDGNASGFDSNDLRKSSAKLKAIVESSDGELPHSPDVANKLLTLPMCTDVYQFEAEELERFRRQKEQEKADFEVALALQKEFNKSRISPIRRNKNSKERYSIRNWLKTADDTQNSSASTAVPNSKINSSASITKDRKKSPVKLNSVAITSATVTISKTTVSTPKKGPDFKNGTSVPSPLANIVNSHSINNNLSPYTKRDLRSNSKMGPYGIL